jgi:hypothetical protein
MKRLSSLAVLAALALPCRAFAGAAKEQRGNQIFQIHYKIKNDARKMMDRILAAIPPDQKEKRLNFRMIWEMTSCSERHWDRVIGKIYEKLRQDASLTDEVRKRRNAAVGRYVAVRQACEFGWQLPQDILDRFSEGRRLAGEDWAYPLSENECLKVSSAMIVPTGFPHQELEKDPVTLEACSAEATEPIQ